MKITIYADNLDDAISKMEEISFQWRLAKSEVSNRIEECEEGDKVYFAGGEIEL